MNSLSFSELQNFSTFLQNEMEGAQLQDLWTNGQILIFQFYKFKELYLVLDTNPQKPNLIYLQNPPRIEKKQKPITLFLHSHGKNLRFLKSQVDPGKGRVLEIELAGGERNCHLEFQLIPKAFNLLAESEGKKISWEKPRELPPAHNPEATTEVSFDWIERGLSWLEERFQTGPREKKPAADSRFKAIEKKRKAQVAIEEQLKEDLAARWKEFGEKLKISSESIDDFQDLYQTKKSRNWNLENAFSQAKALEKKRAGTETRLAKIKEEIAELEKDLQQNPEPKILPGPATQASRLMAKTQTKGRRLQLEDGLEALIGKSAADNLAILRKAQAWDLWLHLKDYPGSHAIIIRPRNHEVSQQAIQKVAEWLIRESLGQQKIQWGIKYDVVVVECRHVRPIKGDRLGRVTYHHPRVFSFASKP
ncbi:MAG: DUF814 domain-containing protein [Pseudobdellovibrionaceae bacterium]